MRTRRRHIAVYMVVLTLVTSLAPRLTMAQEPVIKHSSRGDEATETEDRSEWALQKADQTIARAREIVGLSQRADLRASAEIVILAEDNTPFLSEQIVGRPVWHVVISNWKLELKSAPADFKDSYTRTFDIFVDPRNGHLLKIVSRWPEGVRRIPREPGASSFSEQMQRSGDEKYHAFPEEDSAVNFLDALDGILQGGGNPLLAEQIVGQYVIWSRMGRAPKPMWAITLRGIRALSRGSAPGIDINARNHLRYIVDPQTGEWICASSTPQPEG